MRRSLWIAAAVLIADQGTKLLARQLTEPVTLIPGVLGLSLCQNTGVAFSLLSGRPWLLGLLSLVIVAAGALLLRRYRLGPLPAVSAMLILGGALGNAVDRLFLGSVTDMVELLFVRFAVFNVADIALTVGCALLALSLLLCPGQWSPRPQTSKEGSHEQDEGTHP